MALILNIDCATNEASVGFSNNEHCIAIKQNDAQKEHASFLQVAIKELSAETNISLNDVDAVAVTNGPGSYTGLRVALASAKGICYALDKPLITLSTLEVMTHAAIQHLTTANTIDTQCLFCPMIDARRMEVFTALYDYKLKKILPPHAIEITPDTFYNSLEKNNIYFFGSGAEKCRSVLKHRNVLFLDVRYNVRDVAVLANNALKIKLFSNVAYSEPDYLKEFHQTKK